MGLVSGPKNLRLDGMGVQTTTWELVVNLRLVSYDFELGVKTRLELGLNPKYLRNEGLNVHHCFHILPFLLYKTCRTVGTLGEESFSSIIYTAQGMIRIFMGSCTGNSQL